MTTETKLNNRYTTKGKLRLLLGNLIVPKKIKLNGVEKGEPFFSGLFRMEPGAEDLKQMQALAGAVAKAQWPGRSFKELVFPFTNGDKYAEERKKKGKDGSIYVGGVLIKASSGQEYPPGLAVLEATGPRRLEGNQIAVEGKQKFYNGCFVGVGLSFKAYMKQSEGGIGEHSGVKAFLSSVIWLEDGPRIGGDIAETFRHYAGTVTQEDPTAGADDEITF